MRVLLCSMAITCFFAPTSANADLVLSVQDSELNTGGTGFVDVLISGAMSDDLQIINYEFLITDVGPTVGDLRFAPQTNSETLDPDYIFFGNSGGLTTGRQNAPAFDRMTGGDFTADFADVDVSGGNFLLARLELEHVLADGTAPDLALDDQFDISLVVGFDTFAFNSFGDAVDFDTPISGRVSFSAVPEPSSAVLVLIGGIFSLTRRRRVSLKPQEKILWQETA